MSDSSDAGLWLSYARENRRVAKLTLDAGLYNPCLQNAQQAVEKALKSILIALNQSPQRTHSIRILVEQLKQYGLDVLLQEDEYDLFDSIYVTSKYPPESALPDMMPDEATCQRCLSITDQVLEWASAQVTG